MRGAQSPIVSPLQPLPGSWMFSRRLPPTFSNESMDARFWLAAAAYLLPTFPLGYFWHLRTFHEEYAKLEMYREAVIIPLGLTSMIIQALTFAWLYPRLFDTSHDAWLSSAAAFGAIFGVLAWSFTTLPVAAKYRMTSVKGFLALETAFTIVQFVVTAPLVALVYRAPV